MRLKEFNISWFATILGTEGIALASQFFFPTATICLTYVLTAIHFALSLSTTAKMKLYVSKE